MINVCLIGNGGHSKVVQEMIRRSETHHLSAVLDAKISSKITKNSVVYDNTSKINQYINDDNKFVIGIGNNEMREQIIEDLGLQEENFTTIIDPNSVIASSTIIGYGTVVMPGVIISPDSIIGNHVILNTSCVVEHDNRVDDFVHISPNSTLAGTVSVGKLSHIGAGAVVIPNTTIGENVVVGAGAAVTKNIESNSLAVGVPAIIKEKRENNE